MRNQSRFVQPKMFRSPPLAIMLCFKPSHTSPIPPLYRPPVPNPAAGIRFHRCRRRPPPIRWVPPTPLLPRLYFHGATAAAAAAAATQHLWCTPANPSLWSYCFRHSRPPRPSALHRCDLDPAEDRADRGSSGRGIRLSRVQGPDLSATTTGIPPKRPPPRT